MSIDIDIASRENLLFLNAECLDIAILVLFISWYALKMESEFQDCEF